MPTISWSYGIAIRMYFLDNPLPVFWRARLRSKLVPLFAGRGRSISRSIKETPHKQGGNGDVSEGQKIWGVAPHAAEGRRGDQHSSRAARVRAIIGAAQDRLPHGPHRPARRRRQAAGRGRGALPQGAQRHDRRPQGRTDHPGHRRQPGARQDQAAGAGRALQGAGLDRPARHQRSAGDGRLCAQTPRCR